MDPTLEELEEQSLNEDDNPEVPPSDIVAYNELRSCADLFRMHDQGIIKIQPEFQRDFVWKGPDQTRFIDSLIKQLPIPSMCFALDHKAQRWIVIDGLQRMSTIIRFLQGGDWNLSALDDIEPAIAGKSVAAIKTKDDPLHQYYTRVENLSVPITVLRCDFKKKTHMEYLFTIFHRLNTGGMKLNNQEIRNCIYGGTLNEFLKESDNYPAWRRLNKMRPKQLYRFTKQEIILRFLAFHDKAHTYEGHLAKFLNSYMHEHQNAPEDFIEAKRMLFRGTVGAGSPSRSTYLCVLVRCASRRTPFRDRERYKSGMVTDRHRGGGHPPTPATSPRSIQKLDPIGNTVIGKPIRVALGQR